MTNQELYAHVDHTQLKAFATWQDIVTLCDEAVKYKTASVCVPPCYIKRIHDKYADKVNICTVIGFPLGADASEDKAFQSAHTISQGADEVDMVIPVGAAKEGDWKTVEEDIRAVVDASRSQSEKSGKEVIVKVILETCYLSDDEIVECCKCAMNARADFVKTSTGFGTPKDKDGKALPNGATVHHVALMRKTVGSALGVKASGGVHNAQEAAALIEAGASRIGASSGIKIISTWKE